VDADLIPLSIRVIRSVFVPRDSYSFTMAATLSVQELPKRYLGILVRLDKDAAMSLPRVRHAVVWVGRGWETKQQTVMECRRLVFLLSF
jgi:hypothetical protein